MDDRRGGDVRTPRRCASRSSSSSRCWGRRARSGRSCSPSSSAFRPRMRRRSERSWTSASPTRSRHTAPSPCPARSTCCEALDPLVPLAVASNNGEAIVRIALELAGSLAPLPGGRLRGRGARRQAGTRRLPRGGRGAGCRPGADGRARGLPDRRDRGTGRRLLHDRDPVVSGNAAPGGRRVRIARRGRPRRARARLRARRVACRRARCLCARQAPRRSRRSGCCGSACTRRPSLGRRDVRASARRRR